MAVKLSPVVWQARRLNDSYDPTVERRLEAPGQIRAVFPAEWLAPLQGTSG
jgi:hypothetical protein